MSWLAGSDSAAAREMLATAREFVPRTGAAPAENEAAEVPSSLVPPTPQDEAHQATYAFEQLSMAEPSEAFASAGNAGGAPEGHDAAWESQHNYSSSQPLQYHLYHPPAHDDYAHQSLFIPASLHVELTEKARATYSNSDAGPRVPEEVGGFWGLELLSAPSSRAPAAFDGRSTVRSWLYKGWSERDGRPYALRRIEGYRLPSEAALGAVEAWSRLSSPALVQLKEAFTTRAFGDNSIIFVFDFLPGSSTLAESRLGRDHTRRQAHGNLGQPNWPPPPSLRGVQPGAGGGALSPQTVDAKALWSFVVQITMAIRTVHAAGLSVRSLVPHKVLETSRNRYRLADCGVLDVLQGEAASHALAQQEDLIAFGHLILAFATRSLTASHNLSKSIDMVTHSSGNEIKNLLLFLLSKPNPSKSIDHVVAMAAPHTVELLGDSMSASDALENELSKSLETGRLFRLVTKLGFINERPEFDHDPRWAETGDRYLIKLFRDYVFHQVDEHGRPVTDLTHVVTCLNKLDAGAEERVMLVSRDEQNCLIVSYREIRNCINNAYLDLARVR